MTRKINKRTEKYGQATKHILIGNRECRTPSYYKRGGHPRLEHLPPGPRTPPRNLYMKIDVAGEFIHSPSRFLDAFICAQAESCSSCGAFADAPTTNLLPYYRKTSKFLANVESKGGRALRTVSPGAPVPLQSFSYLMGHHGVHLREGWSQKQYRHKPAQQV